MSYAARAAWTVNLCRKSVQASVTVRRVVHIMINYRACIVGRARARMTQIQENNQNISDSGKRSFRAGEGRSLTRACMHGRDKSQENNRNNFSRACTNTTTVYLTKHTRAC